MCVFLRFVHVNVSVLLCVFASAFLCCWLSCVCVFLLVLVNMWVSVCYSVFWGVCLSFFESLALSPSPSSMRMFVHLCAARCVFRSHRTRFDRYQRCYGVSLCFGVDVCYTCFCVSVRFRLFIISLCLVFCSVCVFVNTSPHRMQLYHPAQSIYSLGRRAM
eukprot:SAG11_NODE_3120_length_2672_cov_1.911776_4_plen_161_part_00